MLFRVKPGVPNNVYCQYHTECIDIGSTYFIAVSFAASHNCRLGFCPGKASGQTKSCSPSNHWCAKSVHESTLTVTLYSKATVTFSLENWFQFKDQ